jgi:hypothetical protein
LYSGNEQRKWISCEDVMNRQPYTVGEDCPFQRQESTLPPFLRARRTLSLHASSSPPHSLSLRLYHLFVNSGLRHLVVLSKTGDVAGIITRSNVYRATEQQENLEQHSALREELPELYQQLLIDGALSDGVITREEWEESLERVRAKGNVPEGRGPVGLISSQGLLEPGINEEDEDELDRNLPKAMTLETPRGPRRAQTGL